jgi:hypothetical protein
VAPDYTGFSHGEARAEVPWSAHRVRLPCEGSGGWAHEAGAGPGEAGVACVGRELE